MNPSSGLVAKLWRLCTTLRKDGVTYQQYVTELTYLLFLKMMAEQDRETEAGGAVNLPEGCRWGDLTAHEGTDLLITYRRMLVSLGEEGGAASPLVQRIYANASTFLRTPANLQTLVTAIDGLDWYSAERDNFGDLYEGLLQKNAEETKKGAGQYFTPRVLIRMMTDLMDPQAGEVVQDPAAGTGGFLIAADAHIRAATDDYADLTERQQRFQARKAYVGAENVPGTYRLLLMNLHLHQVESDHIELADTLSPAGEALPLADLILTNPPFGPAGGKPSRGDLTITANVSSYQLPFTEHCLKRLAPGGRAAIVLPDNVLFEDGKGQKLRRKLMDEANLHTILRLPTGIFYAPGVKTNVVFLEKGPQDCADWTDEVWIYDLRANMPSFGKTSPLTDAHLADFVAAYSAEERVDEGEEGRFRRFAREDIAARGDNLDISWLRDENAEAEAGDPLEVAGEVEAALEEALTAIRALTAELENGAPTAMAAE